MRSKEEIIKDLEKHAEDEGIKLNPDKQVLDVLINKLLQNEEEYGKPYCPCRLERSDENVCPCTNHLKEIKEEGHCLCWLFVK